MLFNKGNRWNGERRVEGVRGVQYTANQGQEWTGTRDTTQRRDFQVSKEGFSDGGGWVPSKKGIARKGL
jgi:hypothetical protein